MFKGVRDSPDTLYWGGRYDAASVGVPRRRVPKGFINRFSQTLDGGKRIPGRPGSTIIYWHLAGLKAKLFQCCGEGAYTLWFARGSSLVVPLSIGLVEAMFVDLVRPCTCPRILDTGE